MSDQVPPKSLNKDRNLPPITLKVMKLVVENIATEMEDDQRRIEEIWKQEPNSIKLEEVRVLRKIGELIDRVGKAVKSNDRVRKALGFRAAAASVEGTREAEKTTEDET